MRWPCVSSPLPVLSWEDGKIRNRWARQARMEANSSMGQTLDEVSHSFKEMAANLEGFIYLCAGKGKVVRGVHFPHPNGPLTSIFLWMAGKDT